MDHGADRRALSSAALNDDAHFIYPANDDYWVFGATIGVHLYEPEIDWFLRRAEERPYSLIDCGANMGYWSVLATSTIYGGHNAVAIEAAKANFEILAMNSRANNDRFALLHCAIAAQSGTQRQLYGRKHYGMSLRKDWHPTDNAFCEEVETITVDDAASMLPPGQTHPALIKIDVEGSEIEAFLGARRNYDEGALFVYEDHGKERAHPVSRFMLAQNDIVVWRLQPDQRPMRIDNLDQVAAIKQDERMGYNFFAHKRSSAWASAIAP